MMAKRRLVVVRDTDSLGADDLAALAVYLEDPAPWTVLALHVAKVDGKRKLFQVAKKKGFLHELPAPKPIGPWIRGEAKRAGALLDDDAARRLQEIIGDDVSRLATCIEQLALYVGDKQTITSADVDELIAETRERSVFDLTDAIGRGDRERALRAAARLFQQRESAVGVAMMLARHVRQLGTVRELLGARASMSQIQETVKLPPFIVSQLVPQARRYTVIALARAVRLVSQADIDLKRAQRRRPRRTDRRRKACRGSPVTRQLIIWEDRRAETGKRSDGEPSERFSIQLGVSGYYFAAFTARVSREILREAVCFLMTPFWAALSSSLIACASCSVDLASLGSPDSMAARTRLT